MAMGELAHDLGIACSTATEHVAALEERGYAIRRRSETDRRQVLVELTAEARAIASHVHEQRRGILDHVLRQLSPQEGAAWVKGLLLLAQTAEQWMDRARVTSGAGTRRGS